MNAPGHHDPAVLIAAVLDAAHRAGCTCSPDVELTEDSITGIHRATVRHDSPCPLLARRSSRWN